MRITGIVLILVGLAALIYGGFSYTTQKREVDMGPIQINKTEHHSIPISPIAGVICVAAGGLMLYSAGRTAH